MKKHIRLITLLTILGITTIITIRQIALYHAADPAYAKAAAQEEAIARVLQARKDRVETEAEGVNTTDPIGPDSVVRVLVLGLDKRVGQTNGHCDVIQMIEINTKKQEVTITAVPRGTYSPLPPGKGVTSSDYYVSNACGLGGLEYGITQIEKIAGMKADYLVVVGFSETLGILRTLKLPTTETLQWLRQRHVYTIGEPQRAHNHSTFIKEMMVKYLAGDTGSKLDTALHYIVYKTVKTDLSFDQAESLVKTLGSFDLNNHPERVHLAMRPAYSVADIPYVPEQLEQYLAKTLAPVKNYLSKDDYSGVDTAAVQEKLLQIIEEKKDDAEFITWAYDNQLWLQVEDTTTRLQFEYDEIKKYLPYAKDDAERKTIVSDYILEMEHAGETQWQEKGKELLVSVLQKK